MVLYKNTGKCKILIFKILFLILNVDIKPNWSLF